jgi:hypothetical protein
MGRYQVFFAAIAAFTISLVKAQDKDAKKKDKKVKMCWNIRYNDEDAFCKGSVNWSLSEDVYYSAPERDDRKFSFCLFNFDFFYQLLRKRMQISLPSGN